MPLWVWVLIFVIAIASRPIEVRLWRRGRISDRTLTVLLLGRLPILVAVVSLLSGVPTFVTVVLVAASLLGPLAFYRWTLNLVREQRAALQPPLT
jgi:hypothetical protein